MGSTVQVSGFRIQGLGFRVWVWGCGSRISGLGLRVWGLGFEVEGVVSRVSEERFIQSLIARGGSILNSTIQTLPRQGDTL